MISTIKKQAKDLWAELDRVDWPGKDKVLGATSTVSVLRLFFSASSENRAVITLALPSAPSAATSRGPGFF